MGVTNYLPNGMILQVPSGPKNQFQSRGNGFYLPELIWKPKMEVWFRWFFFSSIDDIIDWVIFRFHVDFQGWGDKKTFYCLLFVWCYFAWSEKDIAEPFPSEALSHNLLFMVICCGHDGHGIHSPS